MRITLKVLGLAVVAGLALGLTGCSQPSAHVIPKSEPSAKPVFASDADALAAAKAAYLAYLAVSDQIMADGGANPERLLTVVTPAQLQIEQQGYEQVRSNHWHGIGETKLDLISLQGYFPGHRKGIVSAYVCVDYGSTDVVDTAGKSVVWPTRPRVQAMQVTFDLANSGATRLKLADDQPWTEGGVCS